MTEPASIELTIPGDYNAEDLVGFAADETGADFHLFPVLTHSSSGITFVLFNVMHFSLYGVAQATAAEIEAQHQHPPVKPESQDDNNLSPLVPADEDLAPLPHISTPNQKKIIKSHDRTVKPDIDRLSKLNCNKVGVAAKEFERWYGLVSLYSQQDSFHDQINADGEALMTRLKECLKIACPPCMGKNGNKKSANEFIILSSWAESVDCILGNYDEADYWRNLYNKCAENAGMVVPMPPVAAGPDSGPVQTPTPLTCP